MADRMAWFWMIFEPAAMILIMVFIRTVVMDKIRHIDGADFIPWLITGLFGFYIIRESLMRSIGAINATSSLFSYRQVKPIDPVLIRCYVEGMIKTFIFLIFIIVGTFLGVNLIPGEPLGALFYWLFLWLLGTSLGLISSAASGLIPELGKIIRLISLPLMLISGVIFPLNFLPHHFLEYLMWNPVVHGLELLRSSFFSSYRPIPNTSFIYLSYWILGCFAFGLALHLRFEQRLKRQ